MKKMYIGPLLSFIITLCIISFPSQAPASYEQKDEHKYKYETDVYLKAESFTWKEFDDDGDQLLKESGPLFGIGSATKFNFDPLTLKVKGEFFGGRVDYDGQTQGGIPVDSDTDYWGLNIGVDLGWKFVLSEDFSVEPFVGPATKYWNRDIKSTDDAIGIEERWWIVYARAGLHGDRTISDRLKIFAEGGIRIPIYNQNKADLRIIGLRKVEIEPRRKESFFAEAGIKWKKLKAGVYYEGLRFRKSDDERVSGGTIWQPETEADIFGINVGMAF